MPTENTDPAALADRVDQLRSTLAETKAADAEDVKARLETLEQSLEETRQSTDGYTFAGGVPVHGSQAPRGPLTPGSKSYGGRSFYADVAAATLGRDQKAIERLAEAKAMSEGVDSAGGYIVPPQVSQDLVEQRVQSSVVRPLCTSVPVTSDELQVPVVSNGLTAGWVAELAEKPQSDLTLAQISASVFTAAGIAVVSNQLLADSQPAIDRVVNADLAKRLAAVEETAFIAGSGTGQPRGILNTTGVNSVTLATWSATAAEDAIIDAIAAVEANSLTEPTAIVLHPRRWQKLLKLRDVDGRRLTADNVQDGPAKRSLLGIPVYTTVHVPTNLGTGTNEDRVIVGDFREAWVLDREGVKLDSSPHVYFTSNRTALRAETRVGFTAARQPKAFSVVSGAGLV